MSHLNQIHVQISLRSQYCKMRLVKVIFEHCEVMPLVVVVLY